MDYKGVIIEESLENKDVLSEVTILETKVEEVTEEHHTPHLKQWTLHTIEIPEDRGAEVAEKISKVLATSHGHWYADFKNDTHHYIIFRNKVFYVDRESKEQYDEAERYGTSVGIPEHQLINYEGEYKDRL
ncbi:hypothetical protein KKI17_02625 [Patescibacteria group bacterium]|nr:hypothetical protein [Patescibacteria group bacterium]